MNRQVLKVFAIAAGAAVSGSMILWRKLTPTQDPTCLSCESRRIQVLRNKQSHVLGVHCQGCGLYYMPQRDGEYSPLDEDAWCRRQALSDLN